MIRLRSAAVLDAPSLLPRAAFPQFATIKLTEKCNSKCITCDYWQNNEKYSDTITTEKAVNLLKELRAAGIKRIRFSGGEPLLRKDLFEILSTVSREEFASIVLQTNGLLLSKYIEEINKSPLTSISVSIDGIGENNDKVRGIKNHYVKVTSAFQSINKKIKLIGTITSVLAEDLQELLDFCDSNGYDFTFNLPNSTPSFLNSESVRKALEKLWPSEAQVTHICNLLRNRFSTIYVDRMKHYLLTRNIMLKHCTLGYVSIIITSLGDVSPGCYVMKPAGNIHDNSISDIMKSSVYLGTVNRMFHLKCPKCTCGWGISLSIESPFSNYKYSIKRARRLLR